MFCRLNMEFDNLKHRIDLKDIKLNHMHLSLILLYWKTIYYSSPDYKYILAISAQNKTDGQVIKIIILLSADFFCLPYTSR